MIQIILCLLLVVNIFNSENTDIKMFEINNLKSNENQFTVNSGEEFALKIYLNLSIGNSWVFTNKNEIKDSLTFIKSDIQLIREEEYNYLSGRRGYIYYYFKALKETDEPIMIKFCDTLTWLNNDNPDPTAVVKINIS